MRTLLVAAPGDHAGSGGDAFARVHGNFPFGPEQHVHAGAELDQADALALATRSPGLRVNTMRRAINPAICLNTTDVPSPSTVTTFCSFTVEHSSLLATRKHPF